MGIHYVAAEAGNAPRALLCLWSSPGFRLMVGIVWLPLQFRVASYNALGACTGRCEDRASERALHEVNEQVAAHGMAGGSEGYGVPVLRALRPVC